MGIIFSPTRKMWKLGLLLLLVGVFAREEFRGDQVLRITPKTKAQAELLKTWIASNSDKLDVWREPNDAGQPCDVQVHSGDLQDATEMLHRNNIPYKVLIADVEDAVTEETLSNMKNAFFGGFDYERYNSYSDFVSEMQKLAAQYPQKASTFSVGRSYENREMIGIKISSGGFNKPIVWVDGGIHAREWISPASTMYLIRELVTGNNAALNKYDFHILPVFNPDGYEYTRTGGRARLWRKTRSGNGWCKGADPNRNWDSNFGGVGTDPRNPCSDIYPGPYAFSEIETKNVKAYLERIQYRLKSFWTIHAYSQLVLTPWGYKYDLPRDYAEIKRVGDVFANEVSKPYGTRYRVGSPARILYRASGGSIDWAYAKLGVVYSYGLELRDTGRYGFILPTYLIKPTAIETTAALLAAVNAI